MPMQVIHTPRLVLRAPRPEDAVGIFVSYVSDPEVARYMPWRAHQTVSETEEYLRARIDGCESGTHAYWLITCATDDAILGVIELHFQAHAAEVGFLLARAEWGKGCATEALRRVLDTAFSMAKIYRVWGFCDVEHLASARVMERAGMTRERRLRRYGIFPHVSDEPRDVYVYAKTR